MRYRYIKDNLQDYPLSLCCRILQVSRSGYYHWVKRRTQQRRQEEEKILQLINKLNNLLQNIFGINNGEKEQKIPKEYSLYQNYPNPFNPTTTIKYDIPYLGTGLALSAVTLKDYDILGREVATLVNEYKPAGSYEQVFNASSLASGVYVYKLQAGDFVNSKKMILLK